MATPDSAGQLEGPSRYEELYRKAESHRQRYEPQWYLNLAYYQGNQWVGWDGNGIFQPVVPKNRLRLVDNRIQPIVRTEVAKMTKSRPSFVAAPRTADDSDARAAKLSEFGLEYQWSYQRLTPKQRQALLWSRITGAGFWKICWDRGKGDEFEVVLGVDGEPLLDEYGAPVRRDSVEGEVEVKKLAVGDIHVELKTPFEIYVDPLATEDGLESARWVIEKAVRSPSYLKERYKVDIEPDADAPQGITESRTASTGGREGVNVYEYWSRPSPEEPRGKHVVWVKGQTLLNEDNPYDDLPYVMFRGIPVPGRFWPDSVVSQLISPQTELNKIISSIAENAQRIGNPAILKSRQANVQWTGAIGEEILFDDTMPNSVPQFLQVPEIPGYVRERIDRIETSMREISGQHEVTHGQVPTGVTAASAINLLQEQDDTRLGPDITDMEHSITLAGRMILKLMARYYTDERTMRIAGEDGRWDIESFRGSQLDGYQDVDVQPGSSMPRSKAAKQAAMQELLQLVIQYGMPLNQRDLRKFFKDYEVGGLERLFAGLGTEESYTQRENARFLAGEQVEISEWDNHEAHIEAHTELLKSPTLERAEAQTPGVKDALLGHLDLHKQALAPPPMPLPEMNGDPQTQVPPTGAVPFA
jgi:hypothetical protein